MSDNCIISNIAHNSLLTNALNYEAHKDIGNVNIGSKIENNSKLLSTKNWFSITSSKKLVMIVL